MQAKRVAWRRLLNLIPEHYIEDVSVSELNIRTIYGSELFLIGLDRPERIEGLYLDGGVIDEYCRVKPDTFDINVAPTLLWRHGWCHFIGVPRRFGVGASEYKDRYDKACAGELPDSAGFCWPSSEVVPPEELAYYRKTYDERDFQEQFEGSWLNASGGVFHSFDREYNCRPVAYDENLPILVGSDFNVNPMAWVFCHLKGDTLLVFDELWLRDTNTPEAIKTMLKRYASHKGGWQCYGDASSRGRHTSAYETDYNQLANNLTLKAMGRTLHFTRSNPPLCDRFAATNARICSGDGTIKVYISPTCTHLTNDLEVRTYKPGTRQVADFDDVGHISDALGYILYYKWPLRLEPPQGSGRVGITKGPGS